MNRMKKDLLVNETQKTHTLIQTLHNNYVISVSYKFGMITMIAGLIGVPLGSILATRFRHQVENCDPYICAAGLLSSAPMVYLALYLSRSSASWCFLFIFGAQLALNLCWSIVADILLVRSYFAISF